MEMACVFTRQPVSRFAPGAVHLASAGEAVKPGSQRRQHHQQRRDGEEIEEAFMKSRWRARLCGELGRIRNAGASNRNNPVPRVRGFRR